MQPVKRAIIIACALGVLPDMEPAQAADARAKIIPRISVLEPGRAPGGGCIAGFRQGLRELGYIDGKTIRVDYRFADEHPERIKSLAVELVRQTPDVFWTHSPLGAQAAKKASTTVPIVIGVAGYLLEQGLAASLARPGGNVTGFELGDIDLAGKRLQLLKETVPTAVRVAVLVDPTMRAYDGVPGNIQQEARKLGVRLQRVEASAAEGFDAAFAAMVRERADALVITDVPLFAQNTRRIFELALKHRLPTIAGWRRYAEGGSLISYGANVPDVCRRSVTYVDKVLKGARPADLPIQLPDKFELIINRKTAKALGLTIPPTVMVQAGEVID